MNETDAVSCLLCLQADEYGSMIKVCVPPGRIPPSPERVICRRCAGAIVGEYQDLEGEEIGRTYGVQPDPGLPKDPSGPSDDAAAADWDSGLPERGAESVVEVDRSEPQNATRSSSGFEKGSVERE